MAAETFMYTLRTRGNSCSIEIVSFPTRSAPGKALYHDFRGETDELTFVFNPEQGCFEGQLNREGVNKFTMKPITDEESHVIRLDVTFPQEPTLVARFEWEAQLIEEEDISDDLDMDYMDDLLSTVDF